MEHRYTYADRAEFFRPSPVRSVWDVSMQPGMISFAGGNPDLSILPLDELGNVAQRIITERGTDALQYGAGAGLPSLRTKFTELMESGGVHDIDADDVMVTPGSQMGINLTTTLLCNPHDVILAEGPTYVGAIGSFLGHEADIRHVMCDDDGLVPEALIEAIQKARADGKRIAFLYTIPNFSNPTGIRLSVERRQQIVEICRTEGVQIVEDDPYGILSFDGTMLPSMRSMDDSVIYLGSVSKIFSPGLRIGWTVAPPEFHQRMLLASEASALMAGVLSQELTYEYLEHMDWRTHVQSGISRYKARAEALVSGLEETMPEGVSWTTPKGGFFTWLTLPEGVDSDEVLAKAIEKKVVFISGPGFFADGQGKRNLRLSYSRVSEDDIRDGTSRLAEVLS